jgi:hypothetical protein
LETVIHFKPGEEIMREGEKGEGLHKESARIPGGKKLRHIIVISFLAVMFCFCLFPTHSGAEIWTYLDADNSGKWYYDKESLSGTSTGIVVFWVKVVYTQDALRQVIDEEKKKGTYKKSYDSWNYSMFNYACECDRLTCGMQGSIAYSVKGAVLHTHSASPVTEKWEKARTGSVLDNLVTDICRTK